MPCGTGLFRGSLRLSLRDSPSNPFRLRLPGALTPSAQFAEPSVPCFVRKPVEVSAFRALIRPDRMARKRRRVTRHKPTSRAGKTIQRVFPEMLTRSVLAFGCAPRAASAFTLDAGFSSTGFLDGTGQATQDGSPSTTKGKNMKTTTTAQNQNPKGGRNLGQIIKSAYFSPGSVKYNTRACWMAEVVNKDGYSFLVADGETRDKARCIDYGYHFTKGYRTNPTGTYKLSLTLANFTSKSKFDRDFAKGKVRELLEIGQTVMIAAQSAIDEAKKNCLQDEVRNAET